jgi:hypothetical protein
MNPTNDETLDKTDVLPEMALPEIIPAPESLPAAGTPEGDPIAAIDMEPADFASALQMRALNRDQLILWVKDNLKAETDYGSVRGSKDSLWQPGAQKICGMLSLRPFFPDIEKYVDSLVAGAEIKEVLVRCYLLDTQGRAVAQGTGARGCTNNAGERDLNWAIKMAQKSAHIDATNRASGLSAIFTQDYPDEDMDLRPIKGLPEEGYLLQVAADLFGRDKAEATLERLARLRFNKHGGDWQSIQMHHIGAAVKSLRDKAAETQEPGDD